jgi:hypothetical protein
MDLIQPADPQKVRKNSANNRYEPRSAIVSQRPAGQ